MSSQISRRLFNFDEYMRMAETGILGPAERVELIHGEIIRMSPMGPRHAAAVGQGMRAMWERLGSSAVVRGQSTVVLDQLAAPEPDITVLKPGEDRYVEKLPGPSDILLIVEVADSRLEYDMTVKYGMYAILGIPEYWIADLQNYRLLIYSEPEGDTYRSQRELHRGETVAPKLLPHCEISVDLLLP